MRVKVHDGSGTNFLGYGNYVSNVTVYFFQNQDGTLLSKQNAEEPYTEEEISAMNVNGCGYFSIDNNPKIVLDNGKIVYGCQVWWEPIKE